jgi:hypothetical protein
MAEELEYDAMVECLAEAAERQVREADEDDDNNNT